jgi:hypothetical protein
MLVKHKINRLIQEQSRNSREKSRLNCKSYSSADVTDITFLFLLIMCRTIYICAILQLEHFTRPSPSFHSEKSSSKNVYAIISTFSVSLFVVSFSNFFFYLAPHFKMFPLRKNRSVWIQSRLIFSFNFLK